MKMLLMIIPFLFMTDAEALNMRVKIGTELARVIMTTVDDVTPDTPSGPNEDASKCPCKGSGIIVHGDGHTTKCPFHGKGDQGEESPFFEPKSKCNCEDCDCQDCGCLTGECACPSKAAEEAADMKATTVKKKYKYILYHMGAEWCGPCVKMLRDVWPRQADGKSYNNDMRDLLAEHNIRFVALDHTIDSHTKYFKAYKKFRRNKKGNLVYPAILIISNDNPNQVLFSQPFSANKTTMMNNITKFIEAQEDE